MSKSLKIPLPKGGVANALGDTDLPKARILEATNVDIADNGEIRRRAALRGYAALTGVDEAYWSPQHERMYVVKDNVAGYIDSSGAFVSLYVMSVPPCSFGEYNGEVVYADNFGICGFRKDGSIHAALPCPAMIPQFTDAPGGGSLPPGVYSFEVTYVDPITGEEGGTSNGGTLRLDEVGGIEVSPVEMPAGYHMRVYMTPVGSETLFLAATIAPMMKGVITSTPRGKECSTLGLRPLFGGEFAEWVGGRMYTGCNDGLYGVIYFSVPLNPYMSSSMYDFIRVDGHIRFMARAGNVLFVGDSRGVWVLDALDPHKANWRLASPDVPLRRSGVAVLGKDVPLVGEGKPGDDERCVVWLTASGAMVGLPDGSARPAHTGVALPSDMDIVSAGTVVQRGVTQHIFITETTPLVLS